jgi:hypothetical protein
MFTIARLKGGAVFLFSLILSLTASAIYDADNIGQWDKPTKIGPDKEVQGFLVNLGPTGQPSPPMPPRRLRRRKANSYQQYCQRARVTEKRNGCFQHRESWRSSGALKG